MGSKLEADLHLVSCEVGHRTYVEACYSVNLWLVMHGLAAPQAARAVIRSTGVPAQQSCAR